MAILNESLGSNILSHEFFKQIEILRRSCNDYEGLQKKLSHLMNNNSDIKNDLTELIKMLEYMVPSYSLDLLTVIIIAAGNINV